MTGGDGLWILTGKKKATQTLLSLTVLQNEEFLTGKVSQ